jgi:uncharacterized membrane protein
MTRPVWLLVLAAALLLGTKEASAHHHHGGVPMSSDSAAHHHHEGEQMSSDSAALHHREGGQMPSDSAAAIRVGGSTPADSGHVRPPAARYVMPPIGQALAEHAHNRIVHFPIALSVVGLLFLILSRRGRSGLADAARWLIGLAALGAVAAFVTGLLQARDFRGDAREWVVLVHRGWGIAGTAAVVVWALLAAWGPSRRYALAWGFLAVAIVLIAAYYGGIVAYSD